MVYRSPTGLPRLDLILGKASDDPAAARAAFTYGTDDFFANAFDASTAGNKSGVQLNAAESDEQRQREDDEWDSFREGMAELAYLQEQITIGGITMTVAEHGRLGKRLTEDAAFRSAVSAKMKADNPNLTDAQIDTAMDRYSEWARLKNIPPEKRTDEQNERIRELSSDPSFDAVVKGATRYTENLNVPRATMAQISSASTSFASAGLAQVGNTRASLVSDVAFEASQTNASTASAAEPAPATQSGLRPEFSAAVNNPPVVSKPEDLALAADNARQHNAASFSI